MTFIEGEITIARPAAAVFDFAADQRNEPRYNPRMVRAEKVTGGPVRKGTVFRSAVRAAGRPTEMRSKLTGYHRPGWLASRTTMAQADIAGTLTFAPVPGGTRMRWAWVVRPKGASRLLTPVISRIGRRQERAIWTGMKRYLEAHPQRARDEHHPDEHVRRQQFADAQDRDALGRQQHQQQQHDRVGRRQAGVGSHARIGPALCPSHWPLLGLAGPPDSVVSLRTHGAEGTRRT